ncbi:MAG: hypothetical protein QOK15_1103 [Nocardioidaceae bacterium]|nr:hypothetical protein [Nocardioidaceae bacterium]
MTVVPTRLPRSNPLEQQVDPRAVLAFLDAVEGQPDVEPHSLMIVRHGHVVAEGWWAPYSEDCRQLLYSLSKSFTSTAAAFAVAEGLIDPDDTLLSHFPELDAEVTDPRSRAITLRHCLSMASGHTRDMLDEAAAVDLEEPVRGFLLLPPEQEPGSVFAYSQPCTYAVASVIQRNAGVPLTEYLRPRLFDPLGIGDVGWQSWTAGREQGFTGLHARTEDIAKLGLLYLDGGRFNDAQLLSPDWVAEATRKHVDNSERPDPDWAQGYGYQFWMARHGYRGDGAFGQFCVVLPEHDTVVVTTALTEQMQLVLDAMWEHLLPGLGGGTGGTRPQEDTGTQAELCNRLRSLRLPTAARRSAPADPADGAASFRVVDPGQSADSSSALVAVAVAPHGNGWEITLSEPDNAVTLPLGTGDWAVSSPEDRHGARIPVAAAGGWADDGTLRADVVFLETPHHLELTCSLADRTARATWRHAAPLGSDRLEHLHCP